MGQAWIAKGRADDRRISDGGLKGMKWASIAGRWFKIAPFEVVVGFLVTATAIVVVLRALPGKVPRRRSHVRSACATLQSGGAGVQLFRRLASGRVSGRRLPLHCVTRLAPEKELEDEEQ